jgi:hypothetical protein
MPEFDRRLRQWILIAVTTLAISAAFSALTRLSQLEGVASVKGP